MKNKHVVLALILSVLVLNVGCKKSDKAIFKSWNDCSSLSALKEYVKDVTNKKSKNYIPVEDRIATFDMDGTFYGELFPTYLEYNLLEYRGLFDTNYNAPEDVKEAATDIKNFVEDGIKLPDHFELKHANAQAKAFAGMTLKEFDSYVKAYLDKPCWGFDNMKYGQAFYKPIVEVFDYLRENDFTFYVVSGSDRFICRSLVCDALDISPEYVIGMDVRLDAVNNNEPMSMTDGLNYVFTPSDQIKRSDELLIKNLKFNKVRQIAQEIGKVPVMSFGNSSGDVSMHNYALSNDEYKSIAFMLIADDEDRDYANREKALKLGETWKESGYNVISMRDDFKTIYGDGVVKSNNNK